MNKQTTFTASVELGKFFDGLRATGTVLVGTNAQLTGLLVDALDAMCANTRAAKADADTLARDFEVIAEAMVYADEDDGTTEYPEDGDDDQE